MSKEFIESFLRMDLPGSGRESGRMNRQQASLKQLGLDPGMEVAMKELSTKLRGMVNLLYRSILLVMC